MPNVSQVIKLRQHQRLRDQRSPWGRLGLVSGILISLLLAVLSLACLWYSADLRRDLPPASALAALLEPPDGTLLQPTRLYDRTHEHILMTLENPAAAGRQYLHIDRDSQETTREISEYLIEATIAELDPSFWKHPGYSLSGLSDGTHTTLAQKLISDLVLVDEAPTLRRNIRERWLAAQVTAEYGREKVLEWYLNSAEYGDLIYGADAAARVYFGKSAAQLSLAEAAMLTAMEENPGIDHSIGLKALIQQQQLIIQRMLVDGYISANETRQAMAETLQFQKWIDPVSMAPVFTNTVLLQMSTKIPLERIHRGGIEIDSTLDYGLQVQADCARQIQLTRISGSSAPATTLDGSPCAAGDLLPTLDTTGVNVGEDLTAEVVILDPNSGQVLAMTGGVDKAASPTFLAAHPAGKILSPFLAITAFTQGMSPASLLWDVPATNGITITIPAQAVQTRLSPPSYQGPVSLREAIANDYAGASTQVLQQVGIEDVFTIENQFGINTPSIHPGSEDLLDQLYSQPISLLESVQAYSVLANQGKMTGQPGIGNGTGKTTNGLSSTVILRVMGPDGQVWLDWTVPASLPVVTPQIAYLTSNLLSDEKARWPSLGHPNALEIGRPAAVKASLVMNADNAWTIGYTPQLAIGVWMGNTQTEAGGLVAEMPAGLWHALMEYSMNEMPVQEFVIPAGISRVQVCEPSGMLVSPLCPDIVQEVFLEGYEPKQVDDLYQKYYIDRETGKLATIFTPPDLVDERVFITVPDEALNWAKASGLALPPITYDPILADAPASSEVQITSPGLGNYVRGQVRINGSATGDDFSYYRLQVGQGLNPHEWLLIGEDIDQPVRGGLLGTWDTKRSEGAYIIELMVVRQDLRIERDILQIRVDNTPPQVKILAPKEGEQLANQQGESIVVDVSVSDNQGIQRVEFYIDNTLVTTLYETPYVIPWDTQLGDHSLRIKAYDFAGNFSEASSTFSNRK